MPIACENFLQHATGDLLHYPSNCVWLSREIEQRWWVLPESRRSRETIFKRGTERTSNVMTLILKAVRPLLLVSYCRGAGGVNGAH
jgi:hypothetical protein